MNLSKTGEVKAHHLACHDVYCLGVKFYGSNISKDRGLLFVLFDPEVSIAENMNGAAFLSSYQHNLGESVNFL